MPNPRRQRPKPLPPALPGVGPPLSVVDTWELLGRLGDLRERLVLVGGQAINVWVDYYGRQGRVPELLPVLPLTSKDVDFYGTRPQVEEVAQRIQGRAVLPTMDDATGMVGYVLYVDATGYQRQLDLVPPFGMDANEVVAESIPMQLPGPPGPPFRVMTPLHCLESRVHNVVGLGGHYRLAQGLNQLLAAVVCTREFLRDALDQPAGPDLHPVRVVLIRNERLFRFCTQDHNGKVVLALTGIDPFAAVCVDPRLGPGFLTIRLPQMRARLADVRRKVGAYTPDRP